jgi:hypothetical protein
MPPRDEAKFCKTWFDRFVKADKAKKAWEDRFEVSTCKEYLQGNQLDEPFDQFDQRKAQVNRIHPSVKASIPTLYFHSPYVKVVANPAIADTPGPIPGMSIDDKVQLLADTGNTLVRMQSTHFDEVTHLGLKEAHWAFACVRVMHEVNPTENPNILAPPLKESKDTPEPPMRLGNVLGLNEAFKAGPLVESERFYVKRIPARQVLVAADHTGVISEIPWVGYWALYYLEDVKNSKAYKNNDDLKPSGIKTNEDDDRPASADGPQKSEKIKLYHIWDQRTKTYFIFADGSEKGPLLEERFKRLPLRFLRLDVDPDSFYPIPPIYHQLGTQDESNDSHEWLRKNRKGTVPRFTYDRGAIEPKDMKKLESGEMGTYVPRDENTHGVIEAVPQPNYSQVAAQTLAIAQQDFNEVSMVAGERRGVPQSKTATQAQIIDVRSQATESFDRVTVSKWLSSIIEEMILLAAEKMSLGWWVMVNADPTATGFPDEARNIAGMWKQISHTDLVEATQGIEWHVVIEEESMSPVSEDRERQQWMNTLTFFQDPIISRLMAFSPEMRKRTLRFNGIKSARDQELIGRAFQQLVEFEQRMAALGGPAPKGVPSPPAPSGGGPPAPPGPTGPEGGPGPGEVPKGPAGARVPM